MSTQQELREGWIMLGFTLGALAFLLIAGWVFQ
jgi:hypothetical protein